MQKDFQRILLLFPWADRKKIYAKRTGGQTNKNFIVEVGKKKFFVRFPWERSDVINRSAEGKNIVALLRNKKLRRILPWHHVYILKQKNILAPKSRDVFNLPDGTMVTKYIEGREFTWKDFRKTKYRTALASLLFTFHASKVRFVNSYDVFRDEIRKYQHAAKDYPIKQFLDEKTMLRLQEIEKEAEQKLSSLISSLKRGISTHNDLIFQNVLIGKNGRLYLLDFEYAGLNKKGGILYDFGSLLAENLSPESSMAQDLFGQFLLFADRIYKKKLDRNQIYWCAAASILVQAWWGILRYFSASNKGRPYFQKYVRKRIREVFTFVRQLKKI